VLVIVYWPIIQKYIKIKSKLTIFNYVTLSKKTTLNIGYILKWFNFSQWLKSVFSPHNKF